MSVLKVKSDENIHAANLLIDKSLFTASVHCSYYAAFQNISWRTAVELDIKNRMHIRQDKVLINM